MGPVGTSSVPNLSPPNGVAPTAVPVVGRGPAGEPHRGPLLRLGHCPLRVAMTSEGQEPAGGTASPRAIPGLPQLGTSLRLSGSEPGMHYNVTPPTLLCEEPGVIQSENTEGVVTAVAQARIVEWQERDAVSVSGAFFATALLSSWDGPRVATVRAAAAVQHPRAHTGARGRTMDQAGLFLGPQVLWEVMQQSPAAGGLNDTIA